MYINIDIIDSETGEIISGSPAPVVIVPQNGNATPANTVRVPFNEQEYFTVNHNLGYWPIVQVFENGQLIGVDFTHNSLNSFTIQAIGVYNGVILYR